MSSLHEQYETLLRRGMPEHPRLTPNVYAGNKDGAVWEGGDGIISNDDARDLITMHALRWYMGEEWTNWTGALHQLGPLIPGTMRQDLLDAIIAATGHLEPTP